MNLFLARQPIFDLKQKVMGYELLFRNGIDQVFLESDGEYASVAVINHNFFSVNASEITGGKMAFINFTQDLLMSEVAFALPSSILVVELLETVEVDEKVVDVCRRLKREGYKLALDDYVFHTKWEPLLPLVDIIKIDFLATSPEERQKIAQQISGFGIALLAEKIETQDDFFEAKQIGCSYFQGYFFSKPTFIAGKAVSYSQSARLRLLQEVGGRDPNPAKVRKIIETEVGLSYLLLRYINSASFGLRSKVRSVEHAINLLGTRELSRWITLITMRGMLEGKPEELITTAALRAKFGELLAQKSVLPIAAEEVFATGLFSLIDVIIGKPIKEVLSELALAEGIRAALLGEEHSYREILDLIFAYEKGDWNRVGLISSPLGLNEKSVSSCYLNALVWTEELMSA
jgi:EAL and modified HD-GYP domain-containing signal transduction protein